MEKLRKVIDILIKGIPLFVICSGLLLCTIIFALGTSQPFPFVDSFVLGESLLLLTIIAFALGFLYLIFGIGLYIFHRNKNVKTTYESKLILTGVISIIINFILFFFISVLLSFFGLSLTGSSLPILPRANDYPTGGFPIEELQILEVKQLTPCTDGYCYCDVTIKNTSSTLTAVNISLNQPNGNVYVDSHKQIPPNSVLTLQGADIEENACQGFTIDDAGIIN